MIKQSCRRDLKLDALSIISKVTNEDIGIINNQTIKRIKIDTFTITIEDDQGNK